MSSKVELYRGLCDREPSIPLFSQAWWLDSVAGLGGWDVAIVEENGDIVATMPFVVKKRLGFTIISQPVLTQSLGPWLKTSSAKYSRQLSLQKKRIQALFAQLPEFDYFQQNWHACHTNWLPVYWLGFRQTTRYTYVIPDLSDLNAVYANFDASYRNKIKKAEKLVQVKEDLAIEDFFKINERTFRRQRINIPYSLEFLRTHDTIINKAGRRKIFYAVDHADNIHSALYLTWDSSSSYVHLVGEDPELRNSGAGILLIWQAIRYSAEILKLNRFDFEGSMLETVEPVRRDCGGVQVPYFTISKTNSRLLKAALFLRELRAAN